MGFSRRNILAVSMAALTSGCYHARAPNLLEQDAGVTFEPFDGEFSQIIDVGATPRIISNGHLWAEGPAWDGERQRLYFTDVPRNRAYSWSDAGGIAVFLDPSGIAPEQALGMREPGANGLLLSRSGKLLICNHGLRAVEALDFRSGERQVLVSEYGAQRFNSPNDLIEASDGTIYFTDPPYGLEGLNDSALKEMEVNGVYRIDTDGQSSRLVEDMTFPNGVALSPDEKWLYVSQSDPEAPLIRRYAISEGELQNPGGEKAWFDARRFMHPVGGLPDGMAVTAQGYVLLAGPGGVLVITASGECLGRIATGKPTANCAFGEDGRTLFITASDRLIAVRTKVTGLGQF